MNSLLWLNTLSTSSGMKSKYFLTLARMQAGAGLVARKFECSRQYRGQLPRTRPRTVSPRPRPMPKTDSPRPRPRPRTWNPRRRPRTDCLRRRSRTGSPTVQCQDQELETQDQGRGQLASTVLGAKAMSLRTPYLMSIKGVLRTVHCLQYCTVHHLFHDKKIMTRGLGGPRTPMTPPWLRPCR